MSVFEGAAASVASDWPLLLFFLPAPTAELISITFFSIVPIE